jgi:hypothetical protein
VSSAWLSAAIVEFEQVTLDNGTELFRVRARARRGDDPEPRPLLVTREHDATAQTYEPLSSGGDRRGLLRLAYAVPTERVGPSTAFSLQLPDGYRIELPEPTPGESRTEPEDGQRWEDSEPGWEQPDSPQPGDGSAQRIAELEQELARGQAELESLRGTHGAIEEELRSTRESVAQALSELELAHAERDTARQAIESAQAERDVARQAIESAQAERDVARRDAESARAERDTAQQAAEAARVERDEAPETTRGDRDEHARLTGRVRQLQAQIELLRADATAARPGTDPRIRQLESEREQLATHVRALAELLSIDVRAGDAGDAAELGNAVAEGTAEGLETIRAQAVREANEDAERELRRLRAGTPL